MGATKINSEDRLERKRQNARMRQQRCRARKRAAMAAAIAASKQETSSNHSDADKIVIKRKRKPIKPVIMKAQADFEFKTTVDGVRMSKRAAAHAAALEEHNRIFFAQVEAESEDSNQDDSIDSMEGLPIAHAVVKKGNKPRMQPPSPPSRTGSPMHHYYRHDAYRHAGPYHAPYGYGHGPGPHGKYMPPHHHHHHHHPGYPIPQPHSPPVYRSVYEGRYHHTIPPPPVHGQVIPRAIKYPPMRPPAQPSVVESSSSSIPPAITHSVSEDDRSTPTPAMSPNSAENSCSDDDSLHSMEQQAIAAMLTLSSANLDCRETEESAPVVAPQKPLLMMQ